MQGMTNNTFICYIINPCEIVDLLCLDKIVCNAPLLLISKTFFEKMKQNEMLFNSTSIYKRIIFYDAHNTCRTINLFSTYPELLGFKGRKGNIGTKGVPGDKGERGDVGWRGETGMQVQLKMWKICRNTE